MLILSMVTTCTYVPQAAVEAVDYCLRELCTENMTLFDVNTVANCVDNEC